VRRRRYAHAGQPKADHQRIGEWVYLLEGALESANITRWILERDALELPKELSQSERKHAYEVTVVDEFHRLAQRSFERQEVAAMWERPMLTGARGRPEAIDIALFDKGQGVESRLEFGLFTVGKLRSDAEKLASLSTRTLPSFSAIENYVLLWLERTTKPNSDAELRRNAKGFSEAAAKVEGARVEHVLTSAVDLFSSEINEPRVATIGLFEVTPAPDENG
jgi:hypothetical protein